jgi:hypothetical protein
MTPWNDHFNYLKFDSQAAAQAVLTSVYGADDEGNIIKTSDNHFIHVSGVLTRPTGKFAQTPEVEQEVRKPVKGWHVDVIVRGELPEALRPYDLGELNNPKVVVASDGKE